MYSCESNMGLHGQRKMFYECSGIRNHPGSRHHIGNFGFCISSVPDPHISSREDFLTQKDRTLSFNRSRCHNGRLLHCPERTERNKQIFRFNVELDPQLSTLILLPRAFLLSIPAIERSRTNSTHNDSARQRRRKRRLLNCYSIRKKTPDIQERQLPLQLLAPRWILTHPCLKQQ